jgi:SAM-dependent methyltransferase
MSTSLATTLKRFARQRSTPPAPASTSTSCAFYPYFEAEPTRVIRPADQNPECDSIDGLPVPPRSLFAGYGASSEVYLSSGREHHQAMMRILSSSGWELAETNSILDFGCAGGRMIRCLKDVAVGREIWGVDIRAEHILWCQQHLSPPFRFATTTTYPHLPFEDNSFALIYAGSVFTHIGDLEDTWLLELRRILRPGGLIYATVHDNHAISVILSCQQGDWLHGSALHRQVCELEARYNFLKQGFGMMSITLEPGNAQVFHDRDYLRKRWGQFLTIHSFHDEAYGYQTAVVMSK